ncbi:putative pentatricopeptide repeat-containing protein [Iris pallida]|uniref:Pentatricopeptide repeat-containing protein n=1 Tax=Iris pallida TaxID=29817 RepID=A0AAX6I8C8_IRIPA|nr:putative pentatricopeptide repeat-containing protein [Iris pallida]
MSSTLLLEKSSSKLLPKAPPTPADIDRLAELIKSHPPHLPLDPVLLPHLPLLSSSPAVLPTLLSRLFLSHSPSSKSLNLFLFSLAHSPTIPPHPASLDSVVHSLSRSRHFPQAISLFSQINSHHHPPPSPRTLSILLSRHAKFRPFEETLHAFLSLERTYSDAAAPFGYPHFNALLRAFCSLGRVPEARSLFVRLHSRFPPHPSTLNTLLLGFKEAGNLLAFDVFFHDAVLRGFSPDVVTYNIRIDAYCKMNRFGFALALYRELLLRDDLSPTVETLTTLVHGAGIMKDPAKARQLFDEIPERGLVVDRGAYNALMGALVRGGDFAGAVKLSDEMEEKGFGLDDVSYYTLFCGLRKKGDLEGVCGLYRKMAGKGLVPRVRTVMLLMKFFCESKRCDLGLELWEYLVERGCCPHPHALDLLATGLCGSDRVGEAYKCFKQLAERGRWPSVRSVQLLERVLRRSKEGGKLEELKKMMESLPPKQMQNLEEEDVM